ncbi:MAG: hypothetical protein Q9218_002172 [Villophora microphyllina]
MDFRRKEYITSIDKLSPPPPHPEMPSMPQRRPSGPSDRVSRKGDSWRPQAPLPTGVPQSDFTFRNDASAPRFPPNADHYRPWNDRSHRQNGLRRDGSYRGRGPRVATAARPLLSSKRGSSPEQMLAYADTQNRAQRFLSAADISDSGEEDMDVSGDDKELSSDQTPSLTFASGAEVTPNGIDPNHAQLDSEPPSKRRATAQTAKESKRAASVPKWSNPDPYTVLPPVDEAQRKRKDVVKIIRKARIASEKEVTVENQVATNDDFISFGVGGDNVSHGESPSSSPSEPDNSRGRGMPGAPAGPRSFSHLNNLHGASSGAPGIVEARPSANDLGPPPGMTYNLPKKPEQNANKQYYYPDQAEALGNRKRTHDDDIVGAAPASNKGKKPAVNGSLLQHWVPRGNTNPTPWLNDDHRVTENPGFRLHKEVCDFYEFVRPQEYEQTVREDLLQRLQVAVQKVLPDCNIYCFGSFAAAMYLPNADMDLVVISSTFRTSGHRVAGQTSSDMQRFADHLRRIGLAKHGSIEVIPKAKVPLVKFIDSMTAIRVDVSFENETGLIANDTFKTWKQRYPAMPILSTLIKQFLMMRGLNEVVNGGLGGFSVTCLVTSLLQNLPRVQSGEVAPEQHLGELLLEFLDLYGNQFDLVRTGISMNPPGYYDKRAQARRNPPVYQGQTPLEKLAITDPNNRDNDISGGSRNVALIFRLFSQAYDEVMKSMRSHIRTSLLDWMLGGNYGNFVTQRQRLQGLYRSRWGSGEPSVLTTPVMPVDHHDGALADAEGGNDQSIQPLSGLPVNVFSNPLGSNVVVQPKVMPPKVPNAANKKEADRRRAFNLKRKYPSFAKEIPNSLNPKKSKELVAKFQTAGVASVSKGAHGSRKRKGKKFGSKAEVKPDAKAG